jgi:hypothetical protein
MIACPVLREPLMEDVPGRQAEARLEEADGADREEEEAGGEHDESGGEPTSQMRGRAHSESVVPASGRTPRPSDCQCVLALNEGSPQR